MKTILFQGDSITDAGRDRETDWLSGSGYPTLVSSELGYDFPGEYKFVNRGVSGNRIVDVYARMKCDILNIAPDYMSLLIGVNDVWHEFSNHNGVDPEKFERIYSLLVEEMREKLPDCKLILLEPFVLPGGATADSPEFPNKYRDFSARVKVNAEITKKTAEKYSLPFVALQKKFDDACKTAEPLYWLVDGVHPTAAGHELIKREWIKAFNTIK